MVKRKMRRRRNTVSDIEIQEINSYKKFLLSRVENEMINNVNVLS